MKKITRAVATAVVAAGIIAGAGTMANAATPTPSNLVAPVTISPLNGCCWQD